MAPHQPPLSSPSPADAGLGDFRVQTSAEINALLQLMLAQRTRLVLSSATGHSWTTRLCDVEPAHGQLGLEAHGDATAMRALLGADEIHASAYLDQIRVEFELEGLMFVQGGGGGSLRSPLPTVLYRFQRRQSFRVRPNTRTPQVRWADANASASDAPLRARIADLSLGGLALQLPAEAVLPWVPGQLLKATQVELDRDTRFDADLRVQHLGEATPEGRLVGLAFADLDAEAQRMLQRYIEQTQKFSRMLNRARDT